MARKSIGKTGRPGAAGDGSGPPAPGDAPPARPQRSPADATPAMAQYLEIKAANPDSILWYRMGDFYELFFEDAVVAAAALGIVLTKRGKHLDEDVPMCGVPVVRADEYLQRLIRAGFRVAVCEQLEDPAEAKKRGAKAVLRRDVVRLVTPGTLTEESLLEPRARNYLTALFKPPVAAGAAPLLALASLDISTGELEIGEILASDLPGEMLRLSPSEVIAADALFADKDIRPQVDLARAAATPVPAPSFDSVAGERGLKARLGVGDLSAFGSFSRAEMAAFGALLRYIELTQIGKQPVIRPPRKSGRGASLVVDAASRASLELVRSSSGEHAGSLLSAVDRTVTGPGARELAQRLASPLCEARPVNARLDAVQYLAERESLRSDVREALRAVPDIARAIARLAFQRGSPRDLAAIRDGLSGTRAAAELVTRAGSDMGLPEALGAIGERLGAAGETLLAELKRALVDEPPPVRRDGGFVRAGYRADLDDNRRLRDESRRVLAELEARYQTETGIKSLKVRHNNQIGTYVEVPAAQGRRLLEPEAAARWRHRQTLPNVLRFTTAELAETEGRIATAADRAVAIEGEVFAALAAAVAADERGLLAAAAALAELDHHAGLAELAVEQGYVRPLVDGSTAFEILGGRHPVVEQALRKARAGPFIENDCILGRAEPASPVPGFDEAPSARIQLVTGPNMAGKSTYLRQAALIALLAQAGSFVPARSAHVGVVDRLFSRVGASDDIARGRSTFMVEMIETAGILTQATERSLVILDEIGRGTATFDGLSIAWATVEHLAEVIRCRALFATHFHELTALAGRLPDVANVTMDVKEWHDEIVFLHKVKAGAADRSYGIQVARLAGLPRSVIERAGEVLRVLEAGDARAKSGPALVDELPLFAAARPRSPAPAPEGRAVLDALAAANPDELSPKAALDLVYRLRELSRKPG